MAAGRPVNRPSPRPELTAVAPVVHGAVGTAELAARGVERETAIDFSASTNPLGPPPGVLAALRALTAEQVARYPDPNATALRALIAAQQHVDMEQVIVGNGSVELIWLLALAYARPAPERGLIVGPTFGEYERACRLMGAEVEWVTARAEDGFHVDTAEVAARVERAGARLVWLCNPNNPTGVYLRREGIEPLLAACERAGALLVVDEAYVPFAREADTLVPLLASGQLFLLRSMTKDYALPGIRLGYGLGTRVTIEALRTVQPPWSVSAAAQLAGEAALADEAHLERSRDEVWAARRLLADGLRARRLAVTEPAANFVLAEVPLGWQSAAELRAALFARGCVVRDCASFGLPRHFRVGVRTRDE
ncbi:MAG TPA: histidinol-phosphate transaminase, partial [Chloroflexota bacterium]|nr:histidinol-phosphate transaminase [Chloroflexota bacterium]